MINQFSRILLFFMSAIVSSTIFASCGIIRQSPSPKLEMRHFEDNNIIVLVKYQIYGKRRYVYKSTKVLIGNHLYFFEENWNSFIQNCKSYCEDCKDFKEKTGEATPIYNHYLNIPKQKKHDIFYERVREERNRKMDSLGGYPIPMSILHYKYVNHLYTYLGKQNSQIDSTTIFITFKIKGNFLMYNSNCIDLFQYNWFDWYSDKTSGKILCELPTFPLIILKSHTKVLPLTKKEVRKLDLHKAEIDSFVAN